MVLVYTLSKGGDEKEGKGKAYLEVIPTDEVSRTNPFARKAAVLLQLQLADVQMKPRRSRTRRRQDGNRLTSPHSSMAPRNHGTRAQRIPSYCSGPLESLPCAKRRRRPGTGRPCLVGRCRGRHRSWLVVGGGAVDGDGGWDLGGWGVGVVGGHFDGE